MMRKCKIKHDQEMVQSAASCSKLTMSLVNDSLKILNTNTLLFLNYNYTVIFLLIKYDDSLFFSKKEKK